MLARAIAGEALEEPRRSPDGGRVIVGMRQRSSDLWLYDCARGVVTRLTFEGENFAAIWRPDGETVTFSSNRSGAVDLYALRPDRTSPPELLIASEVDKVAGSWRQDGSALLFTEYHPETGADVWVYDRGADRVRPFVQTRFNEYAPVFSPDGRWAAYTSDESGRADVFVVSYPDAAGKRQLSSQGGAEPQWTRDGRELLYRSGDRLMRVDMSRGPAEAGVPQTVFEGRFVPGTVTGLANYDPSPDGFELLMVVEDDAPAPDAQLVTVGWFGELGRS